MTFTLGSWAIPAFITIAAIYVSLREWPQSRGDYDFSPVIGIFYFAVALIVSLVAWLIWSLIA